MNYLLFNLYLFKFQNFQSDFDIISLFYSIKLVASINKMSRKNGHNIAMIKSFACSKIILRIKAVGVRDGRPDENFSP